MNFVVTSTLRAAQNRAVGHTSVGELKLNHGDVTHIGLLGHITVVGF
jgi:hypothetical protein